MDIAKFLDQPIRFNPRRPSAYSVSKISSLPPSPSHEGTRTSSSMPDTPLSPESRSLPTQNPNSSPPRTPPLLAGKNDRVLEGSRQRSATPEPSSKTVDTRQQKGTKNRKSIIKAACSACQRRRSKARLIPLSIALQPYLTTDSVMASARSVPPAL
jgi:hypothetical protein